MNQLPMQHKWCWYGQSCKFGAHVTLVSPDYTFVATRELPAAYTPDTLSRAVKSLMAEARGRAMFVAYKEGMGYIRGKSFDYVRGTEETWTQDLQQARVFKTAHNAAKAIKNVKLEVISVKLTPVHPDED